MTVEDPSSVPESGSSETVPSSPQPPPSPNPEQQAETVIQAIGRLIGTSLRVTLPEERAEGLHAPVLKPGATEDERAAVATDQYQVLGEIAKGGVGVVLKAHDMDLGRDVALKVLRGDRRENTNLIQRFVEKAQIGGQLQHPGIAPVYETGTAPTSDPTSR
jgi:serine/threonine protein kinase